MYSVRRADDRGLVEIEWLKAHHTFSFGHYFDPAHMGFKSLRVINEDYIDEGMGFDTHPHRDMEIITFMVDGKLAHKDSMGNQSTILPGEIQVMSAGTGITHSEFNPDNEHKTHSYQIWVLPHTKSVKPRYEQINYRELVEKNKLLKLVSPDGSDGSIFIYQDLNLWYGKFGKGTKQSLSPDRPGWLQIIKGEVELLDETLRESDGVSWEREKDIQLIAKEDAEFLWFEFLEPRQ